MNFIYVRSWYRDYFNILLQGTIHHGISRCFVYPSRGFLRRVSLATLLNDLGQISVGNVRYKSLPCLPRLPCPPWLAFPLFIWWVPWFLESGNGGGNRGMRWMNATDEAGHAGRAAQHRLQLEIWRVSMRWDGFSVVIWTLYRDLRWMLRKQILRGRFQHRGTGECQMRLKRWPWRWEIASTALLALLALLAPVTGFHYVFLCTTEPLVRSVRCSVQYLIQYRSIANKGWPALNCMAPQKFIASVAEAESHCCCVHNSTDYSLAHYSLSHTRALALSLTSPCPASIQPLVRKSPQTRRLY